MIINSEINIMFEFTAPGTPQQNGLVERAFATLFGNKIHVECSKYPYPIKKGTLGKLS
jgi:transposase InsO family protein